MTVKIDGRVLSPEPKEPPTVIPPDSITAQKKAAIAKEKDTLANIIFYFKAFRGMGQK